jgi:hypothetical protein
MAPGAIMFMIRPIFFKRAYKNDKIRKTLENLQNFYITSLPVVFVALKVPFLLFPPHCHDTPPYFDQQ